MPEHEDGDGASLDARLSVAPTVDFEVAEILGKLEPGERCFLQKHVLEGEKINDAQAACGWPDRRDERGQLIKPYYDVQRLLEKVALLMGEVRPSRSRKEPA